MAILFSQLIRSKPWVILYSFHSFISRLSKSYQLYVTSSKHTQNLINSHHYDHHSSKFQCYHYFSGKNCFLKGLSTSVHNLICFVKMQSRLLTVTFLKTQQYFPLISNYEKRLQFLQKNNTIAHHYLSDFIPYALFLTHHLIPSSK